MCSQKIGGEPNPKTLDETKQLFTDASGAWGGYVHARDTNAKSEPSTLTRDSITDVNPRLELEYEPNKWTP